MQKVLARGRVWGYPLGIERDTMKTTTTTTVKYEHRTTAPVKYEFYGERELAKGAILATTKTPNRFKAYGITLGHGVGADIPSEFVEVVKITRKTTVEITEEKI